MEIKVLHQVMEWNEDVSAEVRRTLKEHKTCLINVMGSPGAGKTSLITGLIARLRDQFAIGVIEGDITGQIDAEKIAALQIPAVQLNTDGACHIEAMSIQHILPNFDLLTWTSWTCCLWRTSAIWSARPSSTSGRTSASRS